MSAADSPCARGVCLQTKPCAPLVCTAYQPLCTQNSMDNGIPLIDQAHLTASGLYWEDSREARGLAAGDRVYGLALSS